MATPDEFVLNIEAFAKKAGDRAHLVVRKLALDVFRSIVLMSPVDTGRFRGNWQVTHGYAPIIPLNVTDKSGAATIAKAEAQVVTAQFGGVIVMGNALPYARALEYGHSKKAPAGMVRVTIQRFNLMLNKAVTETKGAIP